MAGNYLEQLIAEWYEFQGYFVRQNIYVGKRAKGGYECELDIVALNPEKKHLVHVEPSMDADSWAERERRFARKFRAGRKHIPALFKGLDVPGQIEQIAVLVFASKRNREKVGGGQLLLVSELLGQIFRELKDRRLESRAVPENLPILRSFQLVSHYRDVIKGVWERNV